MPSGTDLVAFPEVIPRLRVETDLAAAIKEECARALIASPSRKVPQSEVVRALLREALAARRARKVEPIAEVA